MKVFVTGGAGFIGSNFVRLLLQAQPNCRITVLDALTYAGNLNSLRDLQSQPRFRFEHGDIRDSRLVNSLLAGHDAVVHFAAESHVDRSISDPTAFVQTNVEGTVVLLDAARRLGVSRFVHISTDEVYGSLGPTGLFSENSPLAPNSPYAASKAASDLLVRSYHETFGLHTVITRCSNNYGPYQFPEKLIPLFITNAMHDEPLPLYGDGLNVRDWLHVEDHCRAIARVLEAGQAGEVYNIGGHNEQTNQAITALILRALGKPDSLVRHVQDRPGHDRRYAIDASKIERELGWRPRFDFAQGLAETIAWYQANAAWWEPLRARAVEAQRAAANRIGAGH
ncbi:MAG: dTDP-glucose 4,6-dehydratase [Candidatus Sericytochromatia bacterium]|nr:dTDP-glucose 4,6-dehydratase [Candidatus Sericytochromatia bacterium]